MKISKFLCLLLGFGLVVFIWNVESFGTFQKVKNEGGFIVIPFPGDDVDVPMAWEVKQGLLVCIERRHIFGQDNQSFPLSCEPFGTLPESLQGLVVSSLK